MKKLKYLLLLVLSFMLLFCSNDNNNSNNTQNQNQNPDSSIKFIGKYPEKLIFNREPKYSISDYGAYYYITKKNNKNGIQVTWLVDYNIHNVKKDTYFEIISMNEEGIINLNGYYEVTDSRGNWIYGDGPDYNLDFTKKGVITSSQNSLHVFYYQ